jgi:hypothetical protein
LLIDRPLMRVRRLDQTYSQVAIDPGSGTNGVLLLDCLDNEGALIEDLFLIQRKANNVAIVNLYLSSSALSLGLTVTGGAADSFFLGRAEMPAASPVGQVVHFSLPRLLSPVPHASMIVPTEGPIPQFGGLRIERGMALWAAVDGVGPHPDAPNLGIQGGLY